MESKDILFSVGNFQLEAGKFITFLVCSIVLWGIQAILQRDINSAGNINFITTAAKIIGFGLFIVVALSLFSASNLVSTEFVNSKGINVGLGSQVNGAAIATLWAFIGIESAVLLSNRAKSQKVVKKATLLGLLISMVIYVGITLLAMGILSTAQLQQSQKPLVDTLEMVIGHKGAYVMAILALISLLGSTVGWIVVSAEVPYQAAKSGLFPQWFAKTNQNNSPARSLTLTNGLTQLFLFATISGTVSQAYNFAIVVATLAYLVPYFVTTVYQLKLIVTGETYDIIKGSRVKDGIIASLALIYSLWVIKTGTADLKTFFLGIGLFVIGLLLYPILMRRGKSSTSAIK
jgi:arginine:ornithine antiporter/lysine permease